MKFSAFWIPILIGLLANNVIGQCPQGWEPDGGCTFSKCVQTSQICSTAVNKCCKMSNNQATQAYRRNPKTNQCEMTWCPEGSYKDKGCTMNGCYTMTQACIKNECCEKYYLPGTAGTMSMQPCNNQNQQGMTNPNYPYGSAPQTQYPQQNQYPQNQYPQQQYPQQTQYPQNQYPQNQYPQYVQGQNPQYQYPQTTGYGQPIGYTASGQPVYSTSNGANSQPVYNTAGQLIGYTGQSTTNGIQPAYGGQTQYQQPMYSPTNYQTPTGYGTNPYGTNQYGTNTGYGSGLDPTLLQQACAGDEQSMCAQTVNDAQDQSRSACGDQNVAMSCPMRCGLCNQQQNYGGYNGYQNNNGGYGYQNNYGKKK